MVRNILIALLFISFTLVGLGQAGKVTQLPAQYSNYSADTIFLLIDHQASLLDTTIKDKKELIQLMNLKLFLADSLNNRVMKLFAYETITQHPELFSPKEYLAILIEYGDIQNDVGSTDESIATYFKAAHIADSVQNDTLLAQILSIIGISYKNQENAALALKYLRQSLLINIKLVDSVRISSNYMSLGNAYKLYADKDSTYLDTALSYYVISLKLAEKLNYEKGIAGNHNNIGNVYRHKGKYDESLSHFFHALEINQRNNNKLWVSFNYNNIGTTYRELGNHQSALTYYKKSLAIKQEIEDFAGLRATYENLAETYAALGMYKEAYAHDQIGHELGHQMDNEERRRLSEELEAKFQNEKQDAEIIKLKAEQTVQDLVISGQKKDLDFQDKIREKEKNLIYAMGFILLSLLVTMFVFWRNSMQRKRYTETLKTKNAKIEEINIQIDKTLVNLAHKNGEITDSINYAKRIQAAIMPSEKTIASYLNEAFIYYLPKDIVAGDFYWTEQSGDTILFAVADCTGHGVPGALVSIICHNALNSSIKQLGLTDPGEILDATTDLVIEQFEKSDENVNDGMDIALCSYNKKTKELKFAGANTPLWIVRNNEILEFKANRQPVGRHAHRVPFQTIDVPTESGDMIYLSSDGFVDQFGGDRGKKYLNKRFRQLLVKIALKPTNKHVIALNEAFLEWKGEFEQVDDVCVMGVKIEN